jgi:hypothetical protein
MRGDLSAPVLAIIVTIGLIAAGLIVLAWFWYFAPQAGKTGTLQILGQPVIICLQSSPRAVLSVKNLGTLDLTITGIYAGQMNRTNLNVTVPAGQSKDLTIQLNGSCPSEKIIIDGVIVTTAGTYPTSFTIIRT